MAAPAVPLSEHAAQASASFARLLAEAEGPRKNDEVPQARLIATSISERSAGDIPNTHTSNYTSRRRVYQPSYLVTFKDLYTDRPKGLPASGLACLPDQSHPSAASERDRPFRRGNSSRDLATLRLHRTSRGRVPGVSDVGGRPESPYPPGYSPPIGHRTATASSPLAGLRKKEKEASGPRMVHKPTSAPTTPRLWKRAEEKASAAEEDDEEDFDPEKMEAEEAKWGRRRPPQQEELMEAGGAKVWTPRRRQGSLSKDQELLSQVIGILNKLSVENFHQLCAQLFELEITSLDVLRGIVNIIFDKATLEPTFCSLYAQMCTGWANKAPKFQEPGSDRDMTFRRALLNRCQEMFEKKEKKEKEEKREGVPTVKRVMIGNVIFIGELYRKKLITHKIIHICLSKLLDSVTGSIANKRSESGGRPMEEDVESMCKLFIIVGRDLDVLSSDSRKRMEDYFRSLRGIMANKSLPARIRFLVQDVIEFRQAGWAPKTAKSLK